MDHVIDSHVTPSTWQPAAELAAAATMLLHVAVLGVFAAATVTAVPSIVLAALVGLAAASTLAVALLRAMRSQH